MITDSLLIELRTEELPPKSLKKLGEAFANNICKYLFENGFISNDENFQYFATPRRIAVLVNNVKYQQEDKKIIKKGPSKNIAIKDNKPTPALIGFAKANNVSIDDLIVINDEQYAYEYEQKGLNLSKVISELILNSIKHLPIAKTMHWGTKTYNFVRPIHGLVVLYGDKLINTSLMGIDAKNYTYGHRFLSSGELFIDHVNNYENILANQGKVIASFSKRKEKIEDDINNIVKDLDVKFIKDDNLLEEVTSLVEYPIALVGKFDDTFLEVPQECLILTMKQNQKYFPLINNEGKLINKFIIIANLEEKNQDKVITKGNERVLKARFADAKFFYDQDKKQKLEEYLPKLKNIIYHNKIGNQYERVARLIEISSKIAPLMEVDSNKVKEIARLAKADLVTLMVNEFPELQGIMGKYYALNDGKDKIIANSIEEHYFPRFANDNLPTYKEAIIVSLADKLEYLVGMWYLGFIPTGEKDAYALRRTSLGIIRILLKEDLDLKKLLLITKLSFKDIGITDKIIDDILLFINNRLSIYLRSDYDFDVVNSVINNNISKFNQLYDKLKAVNDFKLLEDAKSLSASNKRVLNILKKNKMGNNKVNTSLLKEKQEQELYNYLEELEPKLDDLVLKDKFFDGLKLLATLNPIIDNFFDNILVISDDEEIKNNRLALLKKLATLLNKIADISQLS